MPSEVSMPGADQGRRRTSEELERDLAQAREQQAATAEILRVISSSPTDAQPVFETIARSGVSLCGALGCVVFVVDAGMIRVAATHGVRPGRVERFCRDYPVPLSAEIDTAQTIRHRRMFHLADIENNPNATATDIEHARLGGYRTRLMVPMVRGDRTLGLIAVTREDPTPFPDQLVELLKTFADQAVIAIEDTRLFEAEQTRTRELTESLEYQTATSNVLNVISRSPTDVQPVFDTIAKSAAQLCRARGCNVFRFDGRLIHIVATHLPASPEGRDSNLKLPPILPGRGSAAARSIADMTIAEIPDIDADPDYELREVARSGKFRSTMAVPMVKDGRPIGAISVARSQAGRFPERQIELLRTFADQAVIAIENTRLFEAEQAGKRELQESLDYQTATSDVLSVISRSPNELQPVLDAIVQTAFSLCPSDRALVMLPHAEGYRVVAREGSTPKQIAEQMQGRLMPVDRGSVFGRVALEGRTIHVEDVRSDPDYTYMLPVDDRRRTALGVPLLREGKIAGVILLIRTKVEPFSQRQIELVETFADQAVIAMNNVRLFEEVQARTRELTESLEQQTATGEILASISASMTDPQPVFDAIVRNVNRLLGTQFANVQLLRDGIVHMPASGGESRAEELVRHYPRPVDHTTVGGQAMLTKEVTQYSLSDVSVAPSATQDFARGFGISVLLAAPMIHNGKVIGAIGAARHEAKPFDDKEIALIKAFADQAVIAIENARLFEEVQARTRELAKTVEDLEIASQHKSQFVANMSHELRTPLAAILGYAELMQEGFYEPQGPKSLDALTRIRSNGKHLLGLINTVLDIAKIESGQFTLNLVEYAMESVVETVRAATESLAETKKLALKTEVATSLPVGFGDEQRLTQVLLNLVGNAIKFTDTGEVHITAKTENGHFAVSVADTGPGIPADQLTRVFEQFHQVDNSNTKKKGGTGLGLAIAKQIVEMHGGRIWVESTLGKGSTFQMELPTGGEFQKTGS